MKVLDHGFVELVSKTGHVGPSVVNAARCSYGSDSDELGERDQKLVRYLLNNGHTSPFRHAFFTFHIKAPLFVFRQWWKYQVGSTWREYEDEHKRPVCFDIQIDTDQGCSWNELSGRYKVMLPEFYRPEKARRNTGRQSSATDEQLTGTMHKCMEHAEYAALKAYDTMLRDGVARELARLVLPPTIYSECYWTVSLQAVLHFLDQRLEPDAQFEIRQYATAVLDLIRPDLKEMGIDHFD
jgi:thymidylate synthase (FAD)